MQCVALNASCINVYDNGPIPCALCFVCYTHVTENIIKCYHKRLFAALADARGDLVQYLYIFMLSGLNSVEVHPNPDCWRLDHRSVNWFRK